MFISVWHFSVQIPQYVFGNLLKLYILFTTFGSYSQLEVIAEHRELSHNHVYNFTDIHRHSKTSQRIRQAFSACRDSAR